MRRSSEKIETKKKSRWRAACRVQERKSEPICSEGVACATEKKRGGVSESIKRCNDPDFNSKLPRKRKKKRKGKCITPTINLIFSQFLLENDIYKAAIRTLVRFNNIK